MSDDVDTDLADFVDPPTAGDLTDVMTAAKLAAMLPKPTLREMIEAVTISRYDLEDAQGRLLAEGLRTEPYEPYIRRAAVLGAAANFLTMIDGKQDAVRKALGGRP